MSPLPESSNITQLLNAVGTTASAQEELLQAVYAQLHAIARRRMSAESPSHTLQPTALINEAFPGLMKEGSVSWRDRRHFLGAASEAMRRVLVDHARRKLAVKRGGSEQRIPLDDQLAYSDEDSQQVIDVNEALTRLVSVDPLRASVVELKFFGGLTTAEISETLELPLRTVERHWTFAKAWLRQEMSS